MYEQFVEGCEALSWHRELIARPIGQSSFNDLCGSVDKLVRTLDNLLLKIAEKDVILADKYDEILSEK